MDPKTPNPDKKKEIPNEYPLEDPAPEESPIEAPQI